jgi:hypothetical protein
MGWRGGARIVPSATATGLEADLAQHASAMFRVSLPHVYPVAQGLLVPHACVLHGLTPLAQRQSTTQPLLS